MSETPANPPENGDTERNVGEVELERVIEELGDLGFSKAEVDFSNDDVIQKAKDMAPQRIKLVLEKTGLKSEELSELSKSELVDKLLGIDLLASYKGSLIAIDVGTGKASTLVNKRRKMEQLKELYQSVGISHAMVLGLRRTPRVEEMLNVAVKIDELIDGGGFYTEVRFGTFEESD